MYRIILASESPRRKEILKPWNSRSHNSNVNEEVEEKEPASMVEALAKLKVVIFGNKSKSRIIPG